MSTDTTMMQAQLLAEVDPERASSHLVELGFTLKQARRLLFVRWLAKHDRLSDWYQEQPGPRAERRAQRGRRAEADYPAAA